MQKSSQAALTAAGALVLALIVFFLLHQPAPSDQEQITTQINAARVAGEQHNASGVMKVVSADYKGQTEFDSNVDQLHLFLSRGLGKAGPVDIIASPPTIQVQGDTATSTGRLTVRGHNDGVVQYDQTITFHWKREEGRRLLLLPSPTWRIVGAEFPAPSE